MWHQCLGVSGCQYAEGLALLPEESLTQQQENGTLWGLRLGLGLGWRNICPCCSLGSRQALQNKEGILIPGLQLRLHMQARYQMDPEHCQKSSQH